MPLCVICNRPTGCTCKGNWRNVACSIEHYQEFMRQHEDVRDKVAYKLRASDGRFTWDIADYVVKHDTVDLFTTTPNRTLDLFETEFLVVLNEEKQNLLKHYDDDGKYVIIQKSQYNDLLKFTNEPQKKRTKKTQEE